MILLLKLRITEVLTSCFINNSEQDIMLISK